MGTGWRLRGARRAINEMEQLRLYRRVALRRQGFACFYCLAPLCHAAATADHKHPRALGGRTSLENIVAACASCNTQKGDQGFASFMRAITQRPPLDAPLAEWDIYLSRRVWRRAWRAIESIQNLAGGEIQ